MGNDIAVSVIIANYNGGKYLGPCLESLLPENQVNTQNIKNSKTQRKAKIPKTQNIKPQTSNLKLQPLNLEIIVVDDGSSDDSVKIITKIQRCKDAKIQSKSQNTKSTKLQKVFSNIKHQPSNVSIKIIKNRINLGAARARNIGAKAARGKYLFFLDNDTVAAENWYEAVVDVFATHPEISVAQVKLLKMGTNRFDYAGDLMGPFGFLIERARSAEDLGQFDRFDQVFAMKSAGVIARRQAFAAIGGFDEDFRFIIEDTDFAWRSWLAGFPVYFAWPVKVWHAYGTKTKKFRAYHYYHYMYMGCRNTLTSLTKNLGGRRLAYVLPLNLVCWLVLGTAFIVSLRVRKGGYIYKGIAAAIVWLPKTLTKRARIQKNRRITDRELFARVGASRSLAYYLGKGLAYLTGRPF